MRWCVFPLIMFPLQWDTINRPAEAGGTITSADDLKASPLCYTPHIFSPPTSSSPIRSRTKGVMFSQLDRLRSSKAHISTLLY
jgi:hypothetical protein